MTQDATNDTKPTDDAETVSLAVQPAEDNKHETQVTSSAEPHTECRNQYCFAPDTPCHLGNVDMAACKNWRDDDRRPARPSNSSERPPWSGLALGSVDLSDIAAIGRVRVVAMVGAPDAGKTSALAAYFIRLRLGHQPNGLSFAGSYTLLGWDEIARHAEFPPHGSRSFPPHTTSGRSPSLLHVRLAGPEARLHDVLFTDVPGEWFEEWTYSVESAPGAQWIADRADLFVLFSDSDALAGPNRGVARTNYEALASRVASAAGARDVYPVRAKADLELPRETDQALAKTDTRLFGRTAQPLSVIRGSDVPKALHFLDEVTGAATSSRPISFRTAMRARDPFLGFSHPGVVA